MRGVENLTNDTPPKKGFLDPPRTVRFPPPSGVSDLFFLYRNPHDRADQKLFWRGPKIFGRARSLVRFPPPIRFAPPHITAQHPPIDNVTRVFDSIIRRTVLGPREFMRTLLPARSLLTLCDFLLMFCQFLSISVIFCCFSANCRLVVC